MIVGVRQMYIENVINKFARQNHFIIGICNADKLNVELKDTPFVKFSADYRSNPKLTMSNANSIIVIGMGYNKIECRVFDDKLRGKISCAAIGLDYHLSIRNALEKLQRKLKNVSRVFKCKVFVDTGPLNERTLALKAKLGTLGRNRFVISQKLGSMFHIGYMLTNLKLSSRNTFHNSLCTNCMKCINACPNNALTKTSFDYEKCVAYQTQANVSEKTLHGWLYGCDICQNVCPCNNHVHVDKINDAEKVMPHVDKIIGMTKRQLHSEFENTAVNWRVSMLKRNAIMIKTGE